MSTSRLPHTRSGNDSQTRRRYNELVDQVTNTVGSIESGTGDVGDLQGQINAFAANTDGTNFSRSIESVLENWGNLSIAATNTDNATGSVTFLTPHSTPPVITCSLVGFAQGTNPDPVSVYVSTVSATGATFIVACGVPTGGGGSTIQNAVVVSWRTIGQ